MAKGHLVTRMKKKKKEPNSFSKKHILGGLMLKCLWPQDKECVILVCLLRFILYLPLLYPVPWNVDPSSAK